MCISAVTVYTGATASFISLTQLSKDLWGQHDILMSTEIKLVITVKKIGF